VAYLLPDTLEDLPHIQAAFDRFKNRCPPTLMADLNVDLYAPAPDLRTRQVADFLAANGMEDMLSHFHSRRRFRHQKTWYQKRYNPDGTIQTILRSRTDCVMTSPTLRHHFRNMQLVDPRIHQSDHHMIKATIKCAPRKAQRKYLQGRRKFPLAPITTNSPTFTQADQLFMELKSYIPRPKQKQPHLWSDCLSNHTKQLIRQRCQLAKSNTHKKDNGPELRRLKKEIEKSRKADIKRRTETVAAETEACLEDQDLQGGWFKLNLWMKHRFDKAFRPSFEDMTKLTDEMEDMHKQVDPQEEPIPTLIAPCEIDDSVPTEDEITLAVKRLKSGKSPGATKMTAAHLKKWCRQAPPPPQRRGNPTARGME